MSKDKAKKGLGGIKKVSSTRLKTEPLGARFFSRTQDF